MQVGCVSEPQTWSVLLQNGTHPTQAWTPEVTLLHCVHVYYDTECLCGAFNFSVCGSFPILTLVNSYLIYHKFPWFVLLITVTYYVQISTAELSALFPRRFRCYGGEYTLPDTEQFGSVFHCLEWSQWYLHICGNCCGQAIQVHVILLFSSAVWFSLIVHVCVTV